MVSDSPRTSLPEVFASTLARIIDDEPSGTLGVAVSGGGDSLALLHLAAEWAGKRARRVHAVTINHGFRPEAGDEARLVADAAQALDVPHDILNWRWDNRGNLQNAARQARYRLLAEWAKEHGHAAVLLGHTRDDQAETLLMRLARGSGVDGLAAMATERRVRGVRFLRPLLTIARLDLRRDLRARGVTWVDDPTNDDQSFDRVRTRKAIEMLGLDPARLAETSARLAEARVALEVMTHRLAAAHLTMEHGDLQFPQTAFGSAPADIRHRLLAHLLCWRSGSPYRPRYRPLSALADRLLEGQGGTLHGCLVTVRRGTIRIAREHAAVAQLATPPDTLWDGFWRVQGTQPPIPGLSVRALGRRALDPLPEASGPRPPRESLMASPAVFDGDRLVAAPLAGLGDGWVCQPAFAVEDCLARLLSH